jgi:hypothetical protein
LTITAFRVRRLVAARLALHARSIPALHSRLLERFAADLRDIHDVIERTELHGHYRVTGGLLLGWAREGAILPHDSLDADFAVNDQDIHRLVRAVPEIVKAGFSCDRCFINNNNEFTELTFMRHGASFDFFRMFPAGDRLRYYLYSAKRTGAIEARASVPEQATVPFSFLGRTWLKHENHELELRSIYGAWDVPDPSWSYLNAANIEARRSWQHSDLDWRGGAAALTRDSAAITGN